jgi:hypothetical protein
MKVLKVILQVVDKGLAVAQLVDGIWAWFKPKRKKLDGLVARRVDRGAPTVVLRRRPPPPPR